MKIRGPFALMSVFLFCANLTYADTFYIAPVAGQGISKGNKQSVAELIKMSIPSEDKVVSKKEGAQWILSPKLLKLDKAYILFLAKTNTKTSEKFSAKMKSNTMTDMDLTVERLTKSVLEEKETENLADVTNITEAEANKSVRRIKNSRQWVVGIGPSWTNNLQSPGGGFTFLLGYEWGLDPDFSVDLSFLTHSGKGDDNSRFTDFSVGLSYYLSRSKYSPFVTGRLGYGSSRINGGCVIFCDTNYNESNGWIGSVALGYKFFRTSSVNIAPMIRYSYIFEKGSLGSAQATSFIFAIYY